MHKVNCYNVGLLGNKNKTTQLCNIYVHKNNKNTGKILMQAYHAEFGME